MGSVMTSVGGGGEVEGFPVMGGDGLENLKGEGGGADGGSSATGGGWFGVAGGGGDAGSMKAARKNTATVRN